MSRSTPRAAPSATASSAGREARRRRGRHAGDPGDHAHRARAFAGSRETSNSSRSTCAGGGQQRGAVDRGERIVVDSDAQPAQHLRADHLADPDGQVERAAPLCRIARRNSPRAPGRPAAGPTLCAPADSPAMVTRSGSPPKAAMFSCTHSSAAIWSSSPNAPEPGRSPTHRKPGRVQPVVERHGDDPVAGEGGAVVERVRAGAELEAAAVDPHQHRQPGRAGSGSRR